MSEKTIFILLAVAAAGFFLLNKKQVSRANANNPNPINSAPTGTGPDTATVITNLENQGGADLAEIGHAITIGQGLVGSFGGGSNP